MAPSFDPYQANLPWLLGAYVVVCDSVGQHNWDGILPAPYLRATFTPARRAGTTPQLVEVTEQTPVQGPAVVIVHPDGGDAELRQWAELARQRQFYVITIAASARRGLIEDVPGAIYRRREPVDPHDAWFGRCLWRFLLVSSPGRWGNPALLEPASQDREEAARSIMAWAIQALDIDWPGMTSGAPTESDLIFDTMQVADEDMTAPVVQKRIFECEAGELCQELSRIWLENALIDQDAEWLARTSRAYTPAGMALLRALLAQGDWDQNLAEALALSMRVTDAFSPAQLVDQPPLGSFPSPIRGELRAALDSWFKKHYQPDRLSTALRKAGEEMRPFLADVRVAVERRDQVAIEQLVPLFRALQQAARGLHAALALLPRGIPLP